MPLILSGTGQISILTGQVCFFAMQTPPEGFLACNGQAISRTTYAALFGAIGTIYGIGDGSTTFNLPDLRGEFIRGWDNGRGVDSGRAFSSAQGHAFQSHDHMTDGTAGSSRHAVRLGTDGIIDATSQTAVADDASYITGSKTGIAGGTETRPRNVALLACIKT